MHVINESTLYSFYHILEVTVQVIVCVLSVQLIIVIATNVMRVIRSCIVYKSTGKKKDRDLMSVRSRHVTQPCC
jgi:hypothetical protein